MTDLSQTLKQQMRLARLPGLDLPAELQVPVYDGFSIMNLPASICAWLGLNDWQTIPLDKQITLFNSRTYRQVIQIVVDGLGLDLFQRFDQEESRENEQWQTFLQSGNLAALTSITPSTTSAALTSLWTGKAPAQHGITGYEMWLREYNLAANMITHTPAFFQFAPGSLTLAGFDPKAFLPVETLGPYLLERKVKPFVLQHKSILGSGLSTMLFSGAEMVPFRGLQDMFMTLEELATDRGAEKRYIYVYWGELDELQHVYGSDNPRVKQEYRSIQHSLMHFIERLRRQSSGDTLILLTADHGQVITEASDRNIVQNYPELVKRLHMLPTGESRLPYLHLRPGTEAEVRQLIENYWPGQFKVVNTESALRSGLFGPTPFHEEIVSRLGDLVLIALDNSYLYWPLNENRLKGRHGGMHPKEMFVPLAMFEC